MPLCLTVIYIINTNFVSQNPTTQAEKGCAWHPIYRNEYDNGVGPSEPMQENFRRAPYASLVREAIQNSLDVVSKKNTGPLEIQFSIGYINTNNFPRFFEIRRHIQACLDNFPNNEKARRVYPPMLSYIDQVTAPGGKLYYIRVSDSNTQGMPYEENGNNDSPFYAFVRSAGVSSKADESAGGSFGFGKAAYFYLSAIRSILVSTKTEDGRYFFEGVSSLCSHKIDGQTLSNLVYYDNNQGKPTTDYNKVPARFQRKDDAGVELGAGTDIFIMGLNADVTEHQAIYDEMYEAVLENFWCAIRDNKLVVRIGKRENERVIDASNIAECISRAYPEHDAHKRKKYNPRPYFDAVNLGGTSDKFVHREVDFNLFSELKRISPNNWGKVHYYFYKTKQASNRIVYMRGLRMKVSVSPARSGEGYYGVILCPDGETNAWLRRTENPAHDLWDSNRLENSFEKRQARTLLELIERQKDMIIREIFNIDAQETLKIKGLENYLYITSEADEEDDGEISSMEGTPTGVYKDEGFSPTTDAEGINSRDTNTSEVLTGSVFRPIKGSSVSHEDGEVLTGRGNRKIKHPHTSKHVSSAKATSRRTSQEDGQDSSVLNPIKVKYRSFAQTEGGVIVHKLIINSDCHVERGRIDLIVGGESSDSKIRIASCSEGEVFENSITNLTIPEGKSVISVVFPDNFKHSVKLAAYEIK